MEIDLYKLRDLVLNRVNIMESFVETSYQN